MRGSGVGATPDTPFDTPFDTPAERHAARAGRFLFRAAYDPHTCISSSEYPHCVARFVPSMRT
jgi:hypothetical protein